MKRTPSQFEALFGSTTQLARALNVPIPTVAAWKHRGCVPAERVLKVEELTGVPRHLIRPDLYPREKMARAG
jgi:DNA-binding transcriptional regulator YdaS (Cro superfamily)